VETVAISTSTYTLKAFNTDGISVGHLWCFRANDDYDAKEKVRLYIREMTIPPEQRLELRRDDRDALIYHRG